MNLQLFLGTTLIGHVPIDSEAAINPTYLAKKRYELEEAYKEQIKESKAKPSFYITAKSSANERRSMKLQNI